MPIIKEITVYQFDELEDSAKEKAREWYRDGALEYEWWDSVYETAATAAKLLGIILSTRKGRTPDIYFRGFWSQGDGSCFAGTYYYAKGSVKAVAAEFPQDKELHQIAADLFAIQARHFFKLQATIEHANRETDIRVYVEKDGQYDCPMDAEDAITEAMRDFNHWIYRRLEAEYEHLMSDEEVDEGIRANEYTFEEDGSVA